jgi:hypothetical protein
MPTYAPQSATSKGVALTFNAAANGDKVPPGCQLVVRNKSGAPITVTLVTGLVLDGDLAVADRVTDPIAATTGVNLVKVPNDQVYRDPADGLVQITFSATANVDYAVIS